MMQIIHRKNMLKVFHENFVQERSDISDMSVQKQRINILKGIRHKNVPLKSDNPLQVFHCPIPDALWNTNNNDLVGDIIK